MFFTNVISPKVDIIPTTNAGKSEYMVHNPDEGLYQVPCHVLLNQAGVLCSRYNHKIMGTSAQQNFIQRMVSTVTGASFPLIYLLGMLFPRHFYAQASLSVGTILGVPPSCCYTSDKHPYGFASNIEQSRTQLTNAESSTSTDPHLTYFNYDVQCNAAMSNIDSRLVARHGFMVDEMSPHGISLRDNKMADLTEGVDSHQAALDLAGTALHIEFTVFLTFTCNQKEHPGISHLHDWKESQDWTECIPE